MKVRTTMRPDLEVEVTEHEANELRSQGVLIEDETEDRQQVAEDRESGE